MIGLNSLINVNDYRKQRLRALEGFYIKYKLYIINLEFQTNNMIS